MNDKSKKLKGPLWRPFPLMVVVSLFAILWWITPPSGLDHNGWHLLSLFSVTILAVILQAIPIGIITLLVIVLLTATQTLTFQEALSGMSLPVVWLIVMAFFVARGIIKTGLGRRIAYNLIYGLGRKTLGLGYGLVVADLFLAPAVPSNTARAGGILFPILKSLSQSFESTPEDGSERKIGSFLFKTVIQTDAAISALFITSMAANPMMVNFMAEQGIHISWGEWFLYASLPGLLSVITIPLIIYYLYPPQLKETPNARAWAQDKLNQMGPIKSEELIMLLVFLLLIGLWIWSGLVGGWDNGMVAMLGVVILLLTGVLDWKDIVGEQDAWSTFLWFSVLLMMAQFMSKMGVMEWVGVSVKSHISGLSWPLAYLLLSLFYFYVHYFFASNTAHISSMYVVCLTVGISLGVPSYLLALTLAYASSLFGGLTHYATGPSPIYFGAGYVALKDWWRIGGLLSFWHILIWGIGGSLWWKFWGLW